MTSLFFAVAVSVFNLTLVSPFQFDGFSLVLENDDLLKDWTLDEPFQKNDQISENSSVKELVDYKNKITFSRQFIFPFSFATIEEYRNESSIIQEEIYRVHKIIDAKTAKSKQANDSGFDRIDPFFDESFLKAAALLAAIDPRYLNDFESLAGDEKRFTREQTFDAYSVYFNAKIRSVGDRILWEKFKDFDVSPESLEQDRAALKNAVVELWRFSQQRPEFAAKFLPSLFEFEDDFSDDLSIRSIVEELMTTSTENPIAVETFRAFLRNFELPETRFDLTTLERDGIRFCATDEPVDQTVLFFIQNGDEDESASLLALLKMARACRDRLKCRFVVFDGRDETSKLLDDATTNVVDPKSFYRKFLGSAVDRFSIPITFVPADVVRRRGRVPFDEYYGVTQRTQYLDHFSFFCCSSTAFLEIPTILLDENGDVLKIWDRRRIARELRREFAARKPATNADPVDFF